MTLKKKMFFSLCVCVCVRACIKALAQIISKREFKLWTILQGLNPRVVTFHAEICVLSHQCVRVYVCVCVCVYVVVSINQTCLIRTVTSAVRCLSWIYDD